MNCQTNNDLVEAIVSLNNKLNRLSPDRVSEEGQLAEIAEQREVLLIEMRNHRKRGHDGKPCPANAPRR
jgi:hypothetical protein